MWAPVPITATPWLPHRYLTFGVCRTYIQDMTISNTKLLCSSQAPDGTMYYVVDSAKMAYVAAQEAGLSDSAKLITEVAIGSGRRLLTFEERS